MEPVRKRLKKKRTFSTDTEEGGAEEEEEDIPGRATTGTITGRSPIVKHSRSRILQDAENSGKIATKRKRGQSTAKTDSDTSVSEDADGSGRLAAVIGTRSEQSATVVAATSDVVLNMSFRRLCMIHCDKKVIASSCSQLTTMLTNFLIYFERSRLKDTSSSHKPPSGLCEAGIFLYNAAQAWALNVDMFGLLVYQIQPTRSGEDEEVQRRAQAANGAVVVAVSGTPAIDDSNGSTGGASDDSPLPSLIKSRTKYRRKILDEDLMPTEVPSMWITGNIKEQCMDVGDALPQCTQVALSFSYTKGVTSSFERSIYEIDSSTGKCKLMQNSKGHFRICNPFHWTGRFSVQWDSYSPFEIVQPQVHLPTLKEKNKHEEKMIGGEEEEVEVGNEVEVMHELPPSPPPSPPSTPVPPSVGGAASPATTGGPLPVSKTCPDDGLVGLSLSRSLEYLPKVQRFTIYHEFLQALVKRYLKKNVEPRLYLNIRRLIYLAGLEHVSRHKETELTRFEDVPRTPFMGYDADVGQTCHPGDVEENEDDSNGDLDESGDEASALLSGGVAQAAIVPLRKGVKTSRHSLEGTFEEKFSRSAHEFVEKFKPTVEILRRKKTQKFDLHKYGDQIIDSFGVENRCDASGLDDSGVAGTSVQSSMKKSFKDLLNASSPTFAEGTKVFLGVLMLANHGNVNVSKKKANPFTVRAASNGSKRKGEAGSSSSAASSLSAASILESDDFEIELLSTRRNYEEVDTKLAQFRTQER